MSSEHYIDSAASCTLTQDTSEKLNTLVMLCSRAADYPLYADINDYGEDYGFPRFFFYYNNTGLLIHASWISVLSAGEWNLFSFTHPDYRQRGCFHEAILQIKNVLSQFPKLPDIYVPAAPENEPANSILRKAQGHIAYSDYLMEINPHRADAGAFPVPPGLIREEFVTDDGAQCFFYHLRTQESGFSGSRSRRQRTRQHTGTIREIGSCLITKTGSNSCFLSHVEIKKKYRNHGFGTLLVSHVLKGLAKQQVVSVKLHTDSRNIPAVRLYQKLGFVISLQIDMWKIDF